MNYFFDTEFIEHEAGIQLVSLGIIDQQGNTFYAENSQINEYLADDFVRNNVFPKLKFWGKGLFNNLKNVTNSNGLSHTEIYADQIRISEELLIFIPENIDPRFFAYYASYDWVVFARLFGRLIDKPKHFPMFVMDLKQMMEERGLTTECKRATHPDPVGEHNALTDAIWNKGLYELIRQKDIIKF